MLPQTSKLSSPLIEPVLTLRDSVNGLKQVQWPGGDIGRATAGPADQCRGWPTLEREARPGVDQRDGARGAQVSEAVASKVGDVELGRRSGMLLVIERRGPKEKFLALFPEVRDTL
jgi:hypothetical protein